jgi:hypothetical protein
LNLVPYLTDFSQNATYDLFGYFRKTVRRNKETTTPGKTTQHLPRLKNHKLTGGI